MDPPPLDAALSAVPPPPWSRRSAAPAGASPLHTDRETQGPAGQPGILGQERMGSSGSAEDHGTVWHCVFTYAR